MSHLTRRELSEYVAAQLLADNTSVIDELAAYLIESKRTKEAPLIVRDVESVLANRGVLVAHVASAHELSSSAKTSLEELLRRTFHADTLHFKETVEPELLGGVKIAAADKELDGTARRTLNQLKSVKV